MYGFVHSTSRPGTANWLLPSWMRSWLAWQRVRQRPRPIACQVVRRDPLASRPPQRIALRSRELCSYARPRPHRPVGIRAFVASDDDVVRAILTVAAVRSI